MPLRRFTMHSNWINGENAPACAQELGAIALMGLMLSGWLIAALILVPAEGEGTDGLSHAERRIGTKVVEICVQASVDGIYHVPESATAGDILQRAGFGADGPTVRNAGQRPPNGARLHLSGEGDSTCELRISQMAAGTKLLFDVPLDINRAGVEELVLLDGIGRKTAAAIVAYRAQHGAFRCIDDLRAIKGFKDKKLERLRKTVEVGRR
jgi:competence protein ComEA